MPSTIFGGLAGAFGKAEQIGHQQRLDDEDRAQKKRDQAIQRAALIAGLSSQGIDMNSGAGGTDDTGNAGDSIPLGDTGYFRHPSMATPHFTYEKTDQGIVKIDQYGKGTYISDASGKPVGAKATDKKIEFDQNGRPTIVDPVNPVLPSDFVGKHETPKVKTASEVNPLSGNVEDVYDDGSRKVIRKATGDEIKKATHVAPDPQPPSQQAIPSGGGYVFVDPKNPTAKATPIMGPDGQQLKPTPPRPPAQLIEAYNANRKQITILDDALAKVAAHPQAVGLIRGRSDTIDQRLDAEGVDARAAIADVGSMTLHDRSGAAVTASEWPRLAPFIPKTSDSYETVVKKLNRMKALVQEQTSFLEDQVGGYTNPGTATPAPGSTPAPKKKGGAFGDLVPSGTP